MYCLDSINYLKPTFEVYFPVLFTRLSKHYHSSTFDKKYNRDTVRLISKKYSIKIVSNNVYCSVNSVNR